MKLRELPPTGKIHNIRVQIPEGVYKDFKLKEKGCKQEVYILTANEKEVVVSNIMVIGKSRSHMKYVFSISPYDGEQIKDWEVA